MKGKIFKSHLSDMEVEVYTSGWITIRQEEESISLGMPPNARVKLVLDALEYVESIHKQVRMKEWKNERRKRTKTIKWNRRLY